MITTINTLEKLCYNNKTAEAAIKLLYKLAIDNEDQSLIAKNNFLDLFQVVLAETVLNLNARLKILQDLEQTYGMSNLLIQAYQRGLKSNSFIGHIHGADENWVSKQYSPTNQEILEYYKIIINKLQATALEKKEFSSTALDALTSRISDQLYYGETKQMLYSIQAIIEQKQFLNKNLRNILVELGTKSSMLNKEDIDFINAILEKFKPQTIKEQLLAFVVEAPWIHEYDNSERRLNLSSKKAIELANKFFLDQVDWLPYIKILLAGEQRQTFYFAEQIARLGYDRKIILQQVIKAYKEIPLNEQNTVFVNGFIIGSEDNEFIRYAINELLLDEATEVHGIRQIRFLKPITSQDINLIKPYIEKNSDYLKNLEYIDLSSLTKEELFVTIDWLISINYSFAMEILYEISRTDTGWNLIEDSLDSYLFVSGILSQKSFLNSSYHIEELLVKSTKKNYSTNKIKFIASELIINYQDYKLSDNSILNRLTYWLLNDYWDESWDIFSTVVLDSSAPKSFDLKLFFNRYKFNNQQLYEWAKVDPSQRAAPAIKYMNIYVEHQDESLSWDKYARHLIDSYGNQADVLNNLTSKFTNFFINTYTAENLYKKRRKLLEELRGHKFTEVDAFAKSQIDNLNRRIEDEKRFGENYKLGY